MLITVLWFTFAVTALALVAMGAARDSVGTAANRVALLRAEWRAEACLAATLAAHAELARSGSLRLHTMPRDLMDASLVRACPGTIHVEPLGAGLPLNSAPGPQLRRTFVAAGIPVAVADSLVDALLDWRDTDDSARALGAESAWYRSRGAHLPRNGPLADVGELRRVRGFDAWIGSNATEGLVALLRADSGRVLPPAAPAAVLEGLPGFTATTARLVEQHRLTHPEPLPELLALLSLVPEEDRAMLSDAYAELGEVTTMAPEGWWIKAQSSGLQDAPRDSMLVVTLAVRVVPDGDRLAVVERRLSP